MSVTFPLMGSNATSWRHREAASLRKSYIPTNFRVDQHKEDPKRESHSSHPSMLLRICLERAETDRAAHYRSQRHEAQAEQ